MSMCSFQKNATFCILLHKNVVFFAFFLYVLCKRMLRICVLLRSLQKNVALFAFFYVLKKRTQKNASFFWVSYVAKNSKKERKRTLLALKERKRMMRTQRKRTQFPTMYRRGKMYNKVTRAAKKMYF